MRPVVLAAAWVAIVAALAIGATPVLAIAALASVGLALLAYRDRRGVALAVAVLGVIGLAHVRWDAANQPPNTSNVVWWANGERQTITGRVAETPETRGSIKRVRIDARQLQTAGGTREISGSVLARVAVSPPLERGDIVRLTGAVTLPPSDGAFDYRAWLARRGVTALMAYPQTRVVGREETAGPLGWMDALRDRAAATLDSAVPSPESGLAAGILLGQRAAVPRQVQDEWNRSGLSHLIVISGYNIAVVAGLTLAALSPMVGRRRAGLVALITIAAYAVFVGLSPPVLRAMLMGAVAVLALVCGRPSGAGCALLVVVAVMLAIEPRSIQDLSFQLSAAATAGLIVLASIPSQWGHRLLAEPVQPVGPTWRSFALVGWDMLAVTVVAMLVTLPFMLASFGRVSLISPVANLLVAPLFPLVLIAGWAGLLAGMVAPPLATVALAPLGALLDLCMAVAARCAAIPWASVDLRQGQTVAAIVVTALLALATAGRWPGRRNRRDDHVIHAPRPLLARPLAVISLAPAAVLLIVAWSIHSGRPARTNEVQVEVMDLAGGYATLITLPGGSRVLVNTGLAPEGAKAAVDQRTGAGERWLTAVVVTRNFPSAYGGLGSLLERYTVATVLAPPEAVAEDTPWLAFARERGVPVVPLTDGLRVEGAGAWLELSPTPGDRGRWRASVKHGRQRLAVEGDDGDLSVVRGPRDTWLRLRMERAEAWLHLPKGGSARVSSDAERIRFYPARGEQVRVVPCEGPCRPTAPQSASKR